MNDDRHAEIQRQADRIAKYMDDIIRVPGTNIRLGWDSIIGVIPGIGDLVPFLAHGYLIIQAGRVGVRKRIYAKMAINALIDLLIGAIPILGDVFDVFWKSNRRNAELLRREIAHRATAKDKSTNR